MRQLAPISTPRWLRGACLVLLSTAIFGSAQPGFAEGGSAATKATATEAEGHRNVVEKYCVRCHNDKALTGGLSLSEFDPAQAATDAETAEKVIRKLQTGMMPPPRTRRPDPETATRLLSFLENRIDQEAAKAPNPGYRPFQRLTRAEYQHAIEDLLGIEIDVTAFLPADTISQGFDNIADVQTLSTTLMEGYLRAAERISRSAIGDPASDASETTYSIPRTASQLEHVPGAPLGTRGGLATEHIFTASGDYVFKVLLHSTPTGQLYGSTADDEKIEISIDGRRVALLPIDPLISESDPNGMQLQSEPVFVTAGTHMVAGTFIEHGSGPVDDIIAPIEHTLADTQIGSAYGVFTVPHLRRLTIGGPFDATGLDATESRARLFSCRPTAAEEEFACAEQILRRIATQAYRRPLEDSDMEGLMSFFQSGSKSGNFETGIKTALQAVLASPHFLFRLERPVTPPEEEVPVQQAESETPVTVFPIDDLALASRLSFFLWGTVPDEELIDLASSGRLSSSETLEQQARRMIDDPRARALSTRFAAQWLRLQDLDKVHPDALRYPHFDQTLAEAMREETLQLFDHLVQTDSSLLELLSADYTFVNERLARHYELPNVAGTQFRRVSLQDPERRGLLGHGSILTLTSHANRTSAVLRGKWVMEVLLGSPPPPPPPDVPDLEATDEKMGGRILTVRERMEEHRANPSCNSCHRIIDPIGLALENFDVTGAWRTKEGDSPVDATGRLYDGRDIGSPSDLREALLDRPIALATTFTENLLAYAVGRRVEYHDMPTVRQITTGAAQNDFRLSAFIVGVILSDPFRMTSLATQEATPRETAGTLPRTEGMNEIGARD